LTVDGQPSTVSRHLPTSNIFHYLRILLVSSLSSHTTPELLALLEQNDSQAFSEIYERYWQRLFSIAYNRLKDQAAAEDIVHDVFAGLWTNRHTAQIEALENYLAVATKYAVLNRLKKILREREALKGLADTPVVDMRLEDQLYHKQLLERVRAEIEKLPARCRLIFKYRREEGLPVKEIAKRMHISPKTVENQLTRALHQLKTGTKSLLHSFFFL